MGKRHRKSNPHVWSTWVLIIYGNSIFQIIIITINGHSTIPILRYNCCCKNGTSVWINGMTQGNHQIIVNDWKGWISNFHSSYLSEWEKEKKNVGIASLQQQFTLSWFIVKRHHRTNPRMLYLPINPWDSKVHTDAGRHCFIGPTTRKTKCKK